MVKKAYIYILSLLIMIPVLSSCIRDEIQECPPLSFALRVKDINYFNIDAVANKGLIDKKDENLPFRYFVSSISYIIRDEAGNTIDKRDLVNISGEDKEVIIQLPSDLQYGKYSISVWGNVKSPKPIDVDYYGADLEHADSQKMDVYMANAVINYELGSEKHTVELERTKGLLIIQAENLPDGINASEKTVHNVFGYVKSGFSYDRLMDITSKTVWTDKTNIVTHTLTGPSKGFETSSLELEFLNYNGNSMLIEERKSLKPENIAITMARNTITVVRFVYVDDTKFDIYVLVNDNWEEVHGLIVEE